MAKLILEVPEEVKAALRLPPDEMEREPSTLIHLAVLGHLQLLREFVVEEGQGRGGARAVLEALLERYHISLDPRGGEGAH